MKRGQIVFENQNGYAQFEWFKENDNPIYRIFYKDGRQLWTNTMEIIKKSLGESKPDIQLSLF